jgi:hypothetical protein
MVNNRLSKRQSYRQKIKFGEADPKYSGYIFNISEEGVGVKTHKPLIPGSQIVFDMILREESYRLLGIAKWTSYIPNEAISAMGIKITSRQKQITFIQKGNSKILNNKR